MKTAIIFLAVTCVGSGNAFAGVIEGRITNLFGKPRPGIQVTYRVTARDPDSGVESQIQPDRSFTTSHEVGKEGTFIAPIDDDKYPDNRMEVYIRLTAPRLKTVTLESLLGTSNHRFDIVMMDAIQVYQRTDQTEAVAYFGSKSSAHVFDKNASIFYPASNGPKIRMLRYFGADHKYVVYSESGRDRLWAFAHNPSCSADGIFGHEVWYFDRQAGGGVWHLYDWAIRVVNSPDQ